MAGFLEEWRADFRTPKPFVIWAVLSLIVGFAGPFGSYLSFPMGLRVAFWGIIMGIALIAGMAVRAFVHGALGLRSFLYGSTLIAAILAILFPPVVHVLLRAMPPSATLTSPGMSEIAIFVFCTSLGVGAYRHATGQIASVMPQQPVSAPLAPEMPNLPRLVERLPEGVQGSLISISVRDHYIDVTTDRGQASLLLRLSDAVAETSADHGAQVHRSHWVAWDAVETAEREGNRMVLRLRDGREVPVSRTYRPLVEARGIGMARTD